VEKGFKERMARGVIGGHTVVNVGVEVHFGKPTKWIHPKRAFQNSRLDGLPQRVFFPEAKPALLEPIVKIHITGAGRS